LATLAMAAGDAPADLGGVVPADDADPDGAGAAAGACVPDDAQAESVMVATTTVRRRGIRGFLR